MSLKDDINGVKRELSTQESFLENFLKLEKFYKKYKFFIIGTIGAIVIATIGNYTYDYIQTQNTIQANQTFNKVLKNPSDKASLELLQSQDENLYKIALMLRDKKTQTGNQFLDQLTNYTQAINTKNIQSVGTITKNQDFLLRDFALLNQAILEAKEGKYKEAKGTLEMIPKDSQIESLVAMLHHFLMTK